ncbi:MAG: hypothetical protein KDJ17_02875 [Hyphomicrobiaceae bacterium]|nr:hypothetical protein [Hyphomicrobiaceae bacterium]
MLQLTRQLSICALICTFDYWVELLEGDACAAPKVFFLTGVFGKRRYGAGIVRRKKEKGLGSSLERDLCRFISLLCLFCRGRQKLEVQGRFSSDL